jgi:hypothetical protein
MKKTYIITKDVKVPIVVTQGVAHRPAQIRYKLYRKGDMVQGELKHSNNKPTFVLVGTMGVIPLDCVQEVTSIPVASTESVSSADGTTETKKEAEVQSNPKVKYGDAMIIGALVGFLGIHLAQKYNYIPAEDNKLKLYGAIGGGLLGMYLVYRSQGTKKAKVKISKSE